MNDWGYLHELVYHRELGKGRRQHEHTEFVDDMGFVLEHRAELWENWTVRYSTACALDFLDRKRAYPGTFLVSVYRLFPDARNHVVTIKLKWSGKITRDLPSEKVAAGRR